MIYLFYGSDVVRVRAQVFAFVAAARKKEPSVSYARFAPEELTPSVLAEVAGAGGLFVSKILVLLDDPFLSEGLDIREYLDALTDSPNIIVLLAPKLSEANVKKIKAVKAYKFDAKFTEEARGFNSALVTALGGGDGKKLWLEIARALQKGDAPEMIHGLLHWKARDLMKRGAPSARALSVSLIRLLQESRKAGADLARSLEKFALSL